MSRLVRLKRLILVALGVLALQSAVLPGHALKHAGSASAETAISQHAGTSVLDNAHPCAVCASGAGQSLSLAVSAPLLVAPLAVARASAGQPFVQGFLDFSQGARAPPLVLS